VVGAPGLISTLENSSRTPKSASTSHTKSRSPVDTPAEVISASIVSPWAIFSTWLAPVSRAIPRMTGSAPHSWTAAASDNPLLSTTLPGMGISPTTMSSSPVESRKFIVSWEKLSCSEQRTWIVQGPGASEQIWASACACSLPSVWPLIAVANILIQIAISVYRTLRRFSVLIQRHNFRIARHSGGILKGRRRTSPFGMRSTLATVAYSLAALRRLVSCPGPSMDAWPHTPFWLRTSSCPLRESFF
jgi:hypothetical protein